MSVPEDQCVRLHVQVALAGQKVQSEEAVVAPAFTNLKVWGKLPNYVFGWVVGGLMDHLHSILVSAQNQDNITNQENTQQEMWDGISDVVGPLKDWNAQHLVV